MDKAIEERKNKGTVSKRKKAAVDIKYCVSCGSCVMYCPVGAISIVGGMYALVNENQCVGCGKCSKVCPASVIDMISREGGNQDNE